MPTDCCASRVVLFNCELLLVDSSNESFINQDVVDDYTEVYFQNGAVDSIVYIEYEFHKTGVFIMNNLLKMANM